MTISTHALADEALRRYPQENGTHRKAFIEGAKWFAALRVPNQPVEAHNKIHSSDGSGSPVEDNPDDPTASRLQQGAATSSKPSTAAEMSRGKGSAAANVAKPQIDPASAPHQSPGPSESSPPSPQETRRALDVSEAMLEAGAKALADDVWHPPQPLKSLSSSDRNKFTRQALLVLKAALSTSPAPAEDVRASVIEECAKVLDDAAQDWRRIRDPGMANNAAAYARRIRSLTSPDPKQAMQDAGWG